MRKFYLKINGVSIADLEDLRAHFVRDEVLGYYRDGSLRRFLDFFPAEKVLTDALDALDPDMAEDDLWAALCGIFGAGEPAEEPAAAPAAPPAPEPGPDEAPPLEDGLRDKIIRDYLDGYTALMAQMVAHRDDFAALYKDARQLEETYLPLFRLQCRELFPQLKQEAPKAIFAIAARDTLRDIWRRALAVKAEGMTGKKVKTKKAAVGSATGFLGLLGYANAALAESLAAELPSSDPLTRYCKANCQTVLGKHCRTWSQRYRGSTQEYFTKWRPAAGLPDGVLLLCMDGMRLRSAADPARVLTDADCCFERVYDPQLCFDGSHYSEGTAHVYYLEV